MKEQRNLHNICSHDQTLLNARVVCLIFVARKRNAAVHACEDVAVAALGAVVVLNLWLLHTLATGIARERHHGSNQGSLRGQEREREVKRERSRERGQEREVKRERSRERERQTAWVQPYKAQAAE